jgi:solute carrier family 10 (sodium/bile acid cotransporter), member 7
MLRFFRQHWFLSSLSLLIAAGLFLGFRGHGPALKPVVSLLNPRYVTVGVLFLMAFSLDSERLRAAFRNPGPVFAGFLLNFGFIPLLAWACSPVQQFEDFRVGLMIAATVPCTLAAASVMTRKAGGNDAVSLLVTMATNIPCFLITPLWLRWTTGTSVELDLWSMMRELLQAVLVPTILGQALRQPRVLHDFAVRYKTPIGVAAQILIESIVFSAALRAGGALHDILPEIGASASTGAGRATLLAVAVVWVTCVGIHLAALGLGVLISRAGRFAPIDHPPVAFAGSQKTLPIGLLISTDPAMFGLTHPFAMFPMLLYHTSQLFIDTAVASRWKQAVEATKNGPESRATGSGT